MARLVFAVVVLFLGVGTSPAVAGLVEITTTMPLEEAQDPARFRAAVVAAVHATAAAAGMASPTLVVITAAIVLRDRVHVRVLLADPEGEHAIGLRVDDRRAPERGDHPPEI